MASRGIWQRTDGLSCCRHPHRGGGRPTLRICCSPRGNDTVLLVGQVGDPSIRPLETYAVQMKIESVQRGEVREIASGTRRAVNSAIDKRPVEAIEVAADGVVGDDIQDLRVHGGSGQAAYIYARKDYAHWEADLGTSFAPGSFGESITIDSWHTDQVRIGDRLVTNGVELEISGPRVPCQKFAARMTELLDADAGVGWVKRFIDARRLGWYVRVLKPGTLRPGLVLDVVLAPATNILGLELFDLYGNDVDDPRASLERALASPIDPRVRASLDSRR